jgi:hypothetical protein
MLRTVHPSTKPVDLEAEMSNRAALCVGVNTYKNYPSATLQGCVNDTTAMKGLLKDYLSFSESDIAVLTDASATKANIMKRLSDMVAGAKAGKLAYLVFSMSSHGTQVPDANGDEPDRVDEAFCPTDLAEKAGNWDPSHIIVDDELASLFKQLPTSVLLEVYLDTCHSGTGLKALDLLPDRKPRFLPPPSPVLVMQMEGKRLRGLGRVMLEKGLPHQILWAACRADQTSSDAHIAGGWHGAFTYFFEKEMRACNNTLSRQAVLAKVRADLAAAHYGQVPQLECPAIDRAVPVKDVHPQRLAAE